MTRGSRFRQAARRDVLRLTAFLADAPPEIAEEMIRLIEARVDQLTRFPFLGRPIANTPLRETNVPYGQSRYVIRYTVSDKVVTIVRIWHGKENRPRWARALTPPAPP